LELKEARKGIQRLPDKPKPLKDVLTNVAGLAGDPGNPETSQSMRGDIAFTDSAEHSAECEVQSFRKVLVFAQSSHHTERLYFKEA
jgi:hypothetical protein